MLLIATCRKLRVVLHLDPFSYFTGGIRDQTLTTLMTCVVRWARSIGKLFIILKYLLTI
jgi:hypothetical protein